jgi:hypothetical protein
MNDSNAPPTYTLTTTEDGAYVFTWTNSAVSEVFPHRRDTRGRYPFTVKFGDAIISTGMVNILDLAERERLQAHCHHLDGQVNWLQLLVQAEKGELVVVSWSVQVAPVPAPAGRG